MIGIIVFYTIYKVTNLINNHFYIGQHQTKNLDDDYLGSGKLIRGAIKKFGRENFIKEILFVFDTKEEMNSKEKELVNLQLVENKTCYNMALGGTGGPIGLGSKRSDESRKLMSDVRLGMKFTEKHKEKLKIAAKNRKTNNRKGTRHTEESKEKIKNARAKQTNNVGGLKNKIWITDGIFEKAIKSEEKIPDGWKKGRTYKPRKSKKADK